MEPSGAENNGRYMNVSAMNSNTKKEGNSAVISPNARGIYLLKRPLSYCRVIPSANMKKPQRLPNKLNVKVEPKPVIPAKKAWGKAKVDPSKCSKVENNRGDIKPITIKGKVKVGTSADKPSLSSGAESIVGSAILKGTQCYLVKWWGREETSFHPVAQVRALYPDIVADFRRPFLKLNTEVGNKTRRTLVLKRVVKPRKKRNTLLRGPIRKPLNIIGYGNVDGVNSYLMTWLPPHKADFVNEAEVTALYPEILKKYKDDLATRKYRNKKDEQ